MIIKWRLLLYSALIQLPLKWRQRFQYSSDCADACWVSADCLRSPDAAVGWSLTVRSAPFSHVWAVSVDTQRTKERRAARRQPEAPGRLGNPRSGRARSLFSPAHQRPWLRNSQNQRRPSLSSGPDAGFLWENFYGALWVLRRSGSLSVLNKLASVRKSQQ